MSSLPIATGVGAAEPLTHDLRDKSYETPRNPCARSLRTIATAQRFRPIFSPQAVFEGPIRATARHDPGLLEYPERRHCAKNCVRRARHVYTVPVAAYRTG